MPPTIADIRKLEHPVIAVDFDGAIVEDQYPEIGRPIQDAVSSLQALKKSGYRLILNTCRTGEALQQARDWCTARHLFWDAVNENLADRVEQFGLDSRKISADIYIDDHNFNILWPPRTTPIDWLTICSVLLSGRNTPTNEKESAS